MGARLRYAGIPLAFFSRARESDSLGSGGRERLSSARPGHPNATKCSCWHATPLTFPLFLPFKHPIISFPHKVGSITEKLV
jgi:hypothetical protein